MPIAIEPIENGESGLNVRKKLNLLINGARDGALGLVTPEDLENLVDTEAPAVPQGLRMSSSVTAGGCVLKVDWAPSLELDFAYYDLQLKEGTGNWVSLQTSVNTYQVVTLSNVIYYARVRAIDKSGNASELSPPIDHETAADDIPPAMPIGMTGKAGIESIWLKWTPNTEADLARYEIYESPYSTEPEADVEATYVSLTASFVRSGMDPETTHHYWVRSVDTSGNASAWSTRVALTTSYVRKPIKIALDGITFRPGEGSGDDFEWTAGQVAYGEDGFEPTIQAIPAGAATFTGNTVYIYYQPGAASFSATSSIVALFTDGGILVGAYKGGLDFQVVEGKAYTDGGMILAQTIGANQLVADQAIITGSIQIADAIIEDAHITELSAEKLTAGSALAGSITVSGKALEDTTEFADNPAARINDAATQIDPGKILIAGATSLSDWRAGPDSTEINGGVVAANSIRANSLEIGLRNIAVDDMVFESNKPSANYVSWSAGTIRFVDDDGEEVSFAIEAGNIEWTSGTIHLFWLKGATTISTSLNYSAAIAADAVRLASYAGGVRLVTDLGRTIIEGSMIRTGTVQTEQLAAEAVTAEKLAAQSVTAEKLSVNSLSAITANIGEMTAGVIRDANSKLIIDATNARIMLYS